MSYDKKVMCWYFDTAVTRLCYCNVDLWCYVLTYYQNNLVEHALARNRNMEIREIDFCVTYQPSRSMFDPCY